MNARTDRTIAFNRKNILEAADQLFSANGVERTTMDQLAAAAGYSKPTLYGYFKDKDEVYFALVYEFMKKVFDEADKIISARLPYPDKFFGVCRAVYRLAESEPLYFEGLIGTINVDVDAPQTPAVYKDIYALGERLNERLAGLISEGKALGCFDGALDTPSLLLFFWSGISGMIRMALQKSGYFRLLRLDQAEFMDFCFERLLYGCKPAQQERV